MNLTWFTLAIVVHGAKVILQSGYLVCVGISEQLSGFRPCVFKLLMIVLSGSLISPFRTTVSTFSEEMEYVWNCILSLRQSSMKSLYSVTCWKITFNFPDESFAWNLL